MSVAEGTRETLAAKFEAIFPHLDERQRRLLMGAEARVPGSWGHRGCGARGRGPGGHGVAGSQPSWTPAPIRWAVLASLAGAASGWLTWTPGCARRCWRWWSRMSAGIRCRRCGGRRSRCARSRPSAPARATARARTRWRSLLHEEGFSLQGNAKALEGKQSPDRDAQFRYLNEQAREHQDAGEPVVSVDTKKKELVGNYHNGGREVAAGG